MAIDEKKLIELCKELKEKETGTFSKGYNKALRDIISTVKSDSFPKMEWIPVSERLPVNAKHKGEFCPRYLIMTIHGETEGWYNPDFESWYVLTWFIDDGRSYSVDMEKGDIPEVVRAHRDAGIVLAWMPLPEAYRKDVE